MCRTEGGDGCVAFAGAVRAEHAGRYVFAVDARRANNDHAAQPQADGAAVTLPSRTAIVSVSAAAGPIATSAADAPAIPAPRVPGGGSSPTTTTPKAKAPKVTLRKRVLRSGKRLTVGSITCATRCRVQLSVGDGRRTAKRTLSVRGTTRLTIVNGTSCARRCASAWSSPSTASDSKTGRVRLGGFGPERVVGERAERVADLGVDLGVHAHPRWEARTSICTAAGSRQARQSTTPSVREYSAV